MKVKEVIKWDVLHFQRIDNRLNGINNAEDQDELSQSSLFLV